MRKLELREVEWPSQGHTARQWQSKGKEVSIPLPDEKDGFRKTKKSSWERVMSRPAMNAQGLGF